MYTLLYLLYPNLTNPWQFVTYRLKLSDASIVDGKYEVKVRKNKNKCINIIQTNTTMNLEMITILFMPLTTLTYHRTYMIWF
jgi:hypothetical protein